MANATAHKKERTALRWPPAKIILMQSPYINQAARNDDDETKEQVAKEKKDKECAIQFCEPVFKPKKHEFL